MNKFEPGDIVTLVNGIGIRGMSGTKGRVLSEGERYVVDSCGSLSVQIDGFARSFSVDRFDLYERPSKTDDSVNHPSHYTQHPSGIEVIQITEHMDFCLGNAIKYIMRAPYKGKTVEDLKKAIWYINRYIENHEKTS